MSLAEELNPKETKTSFDRIPENESDGKITPKSTDSTSFSTLQQRREQKQKEFLEEQQRLLELFTKKIEEADSLFQQRYNEIDQKLKEEMTLKNNILCPSPRKEVHTKHTKHTQ
jgi:hypothetical protein